MSIRIDVIPNQFGTTATLLRKTWCEGKRVRHRTIGNLSDLPPNVIDGFRTILKGGIAVNDPNKLFNIERSLPHGHVAAVLATMEKLGIKRLLGRDKERHRDLAFAAIASRIINPASKLATAQDLDPETCSTSLGSQLKLGSVSSDEMLSMLDWLLERQSWIERSLANKYLQNGTLIFYDVSSSYFEGRCRTRAAFKHNRDGKKGKKKITYGLLCSADGHPIAVEVFAGNTSNPNTIRTQLEKLRSRFRVDNIAFVGDREMLTQARINEDLSPLGFDWITALKNSNIRKFLKSAKDTPAALKPELLTLGSVAEITSTDFPGERLLVCLNPGLREEKRRKREALLLTTEQTLSEIAGAAERRKPGTANRDRIIKDLGGTGNQRKIEKHFDINVHDEGMDWCRNHNRIDEEAKLDGIYVVRTSLNTGAIGSEEAVKAYKSLVNVEHAFQSMKTSRLHIQPTYVYKENHVRAYIFLCMLAWHIERHMRQKLAPILFEDNDKETPQTQRSSPLEPAKVSKSAKKTAAKKRTPTDLPTHSFTTLINDLGALTLNQAFITGQPDSKFQIASEPTKLHEEALRLLELNENKILS